MSLPKPYYDEWKDCPQTHIGLGMVLIRAPKGAEEEKDYAQPCPTCEAHFKGVDEAKKEQREKDAGIAESLEMGEGFAEAIRSATEIIMKSTCGVIAQAIRNQGADIKGGIVK
jgi:hypothetical protein